jgi:hypothetical protein
MPFLDHAMGWWLLDRSAGISQRGIGWFLLSADAPSRLQENSKRQQRATPRALGSADDCGEAVRALLDEAGRFPILV